MELRIDHEFASRIPPLTDEEFKQLEDNILADGVVINPIIVWNGVIVDGHNRFRILESHPDLPYTIHEKSFEDRFSALAWICKNQLGRRNLTPSQKKYLIGKQYEAEKARYGGDRKSEAAKSSSQIGNLISPLKTSERIAKENGISKNSVFRAESFAKAVDIADEIEPGIRSDILSGNVKATAKDVEDIIQAPPDERPQLIDKLRCPPPTKKKEPSSDKAKIQEISEGLTKPRGKATQADMLYELDDALNTLIFRWNICLAANAEYVTDKECHAQIQKRVQTGLDYLNQIKNGEMPQ